uniref:Transposase Tc1-like domain-containing protein n=1 Tax=Seriola lalandi dorsalis TaxID=1841481 RepID=A0A3B4XK47_SERLL
GFPHIIYFAQIDCIIHPNSVRLCLYCDLRPKVTTPLEDQCIKLSSLRDRKTPISKSTVKRRLSCGGLRGRVAGSKPLLTRENKAKRLRWAKKYQNFTVDERRNVIFTDESKFEIYGSNRRECHTIRGLDLFRLDNVSKLYQFASSFDLVHHILNGETKQVVKLW